jgi:hypothetical protein
VVLAAITLLAVTFTLVMMLITLREFSKRVTLLVERFDLLRGMVDTFGRYLFTNFGAPQGYSKIPPMPAPPGEAEGGHD